VAAAVLDLVKLGVPQRRRRHVLLASRDRRLDPPAILATTIACGRHEPRTVEWAIGDLAEIESAAGLDAPSNPTAANASRMRWLIEHDEYDLPNRLRPPCHHNAHSYVSMYGRLRWDGPAQTITTGYGSMGQGRYVHPGDARTITPHEAARLQTIPDFFDLRASNKRSAWAHVIGNSVPPLLGVHIGLPLLTGLVATKSSAQHEVTHTQSVDRTRRAGVPAASSEVIRERMKRTKRRDTSPELKLRSELDDRGLSYLVDQPIDGGRRRRADVVFPDSRVAVYVNGCFWHACPDHGTNPKANAEWWKDKLDANRARDTDTDMRLEEAGWVVLRFWEHDDLVAAAAEVQAAVARRAHENGNGKAPHLRRGSTASR
jgi:DNA mismatch endonuclease Vsr